MNEEIGSNPFDWITCQIGAREHFSVPRALHSAGRLSALYTDIWFSPQSLFSKIRGYQYPDLPPSCIHSFNGAFLWMTAVRHFFSRDFTRSTVAYNELFQKKVLKKLSATDRVDNPNKILFSYSYAAKNLFRYAKKKQWKTVLGQMDGGEEEEKIVQKLHEQHPHLRSSWKPWPKSYWEDWSEECSMADTIIVNSEWAKTLLVKRKISIHKIKLLPLVYPAQVSMQMKPKSYPARFNAARPLRVLFLGQVILRKGIAELFESIKALQNEPIEFYIVGNREVRIPPEIRNNKKVHFFERVPIMKTASFFRDADLFVLPTHSDGFAITLLEAQAWKLPIITSRFCGNVVRSGETGMIMDQVKSNLLTDAIKNCYGSPSLLQRFSDQIDSARNEFSLVTLSRQLQDLETLYPVSA